MSLIKDALFPFTKTQAYREKLHHNAMLMKESLKCQLVGSEESLIRFQSIVVWEIPKRTAFIYGIVGLVIIAFSDVKPFYLLGLCGLLLTFLNFFQKKIWPEVRVPDPDKDLLDEWTPLHARLLGAAEISEKIAYFCCGLELYITAFLTFRRRKPSKFCIVVCFLNILVILIGILVTGRTLVFGLLLLFAVYPGWRYHSLSSRFVASMFPMLQQMENSAHIHRHKYRKAARREANPSQEADDSDDSELDEFKLPKDAATERTLEKALRADYDPENDIDIEECEARERESSQLEGTALLTRLLSGGFSAEESITTRMSDSEEEESYLKDLHRLEIPAAVTDDELDVPDVKQTTEEEKQAATLAAFADQVQPVFNALTSQLPTMVESVQSSVATAIQNVGESWYQSSTGKNSSDVAEEKSTDDQLADNVPSRESVFQHRSAPLVDLSSTDEDIPENPDLRDMVTEVLQQSLLHEDPDLAEDLASQQASLADDSDSDFEVLSNDNIPDNI